MSISRSTGKTWDFRRLLPSGVVVMWPRDGCVPRWMGRPVGAAGPVVVVAASPLNADVRMIHLSPDFQHWADGRPLAVVGEVAAARYDVTVAYYDGSEGQEVLMVPPEWARQGTFVLRVRGDSMQEAGIQDGDYVLVRPQHSADSGDLVIAGLSDSDDPNGYVTLKQYFWEGDHIRLQPANASMAPIHLYPQPHGDPVVIQGKVVAVVRVVAESWD